MSKRSSHPIDALFDFLGDLLAPRGGSGASRSRAAGGFSGGSSGRPAFDSADEQSAWEELDDDLNADRARRRSGGSSTGRDPGGAPSLDRDYAVLQLPAGADFARVKASYKRLLSQYHPDRHSGDPEKQRIATEVTQQLNASYQRIRDHAEGNPPH